MRLIPHLLALVLAVSLFAVPAAAQPSREECAARLERARGQYQVQQFAEVERLLGACVDRLALPATDMDEGFRLLALAYLRENLLADAQAAVIKHLAWSFTYEPDEIRDPPLYVALVRVTRAQLTVPPGALVASAAPTAAPATPPPARVEEPADAGAAGPAETAPAGPPPAPAESGTGAHPEDDGVGLTEGGVAVDVGGGRYGGGVAAVPGTTPAGVGLIGADPATIVEPLEFATVMPEIIGGQAAIRLEYPDFERRAGVEGRVVIRFVVARDGTVSDAEVLRGVGPGLDGAALSALRRLRFTPGRQNGEPVPVRTTLSFEFSLGGRN